MLRHGRVERTLDVKEKAHPAYLEYLQTLFNYIVSFFERALPLVDIQLTIKEEEKKFASSWEAGQVSGWAESSTKPKVAVVNGTGGIWCRYCKSYLSPISASDLHSRPKALLEGDSIRCPPQFGQAQEERISRQRQIRPEQIQRSSGPSHLQLIARQASASRSVHLPCHHPSRLPTYTPTPRRFPLGGRATNGSHSTRAGS